MTLVQCKQAFVGPNRTVVSVGRVLDASDPLVKGRESLFEPVEAQPFGGVEQATAAPGEKRTTRRKSAAKKG